MQSDEMIFRQINGKTAGLAALIQGFVVQYDGKSAVRLRARELNQCFPNLPVEQIRAASGKKSDTAVYASACI